MQQSPPPRWPAVPEDLNRVRRYYARQIFVTGLVAFVVVAAGLAVLAAKGHGVIATFMIAPLVLIVASVLYLWALVRADAPAGRRRAPRKPLSDRLAGWRPWRGRGGHR